MHCWLQQNGPHRTRPDFHLCEPKERCNRSVAQKEGRQPSHTAFLYINQISPVKMVNVINRDNDFTVHRVHRECVFSCVASVVLAQLHSSRSFVWNLSIGDAFRISWSKNCHNSLFESHLPRWIYIECIAFPELVSAFFSPELHTDIFSKTYTTYIGLPACNTTINIFHKNSK